jgi:hypothetical protein|tara:strand:- start:265 stop:459 length:195 start_codon:yes stop_codon:yes gene_type:complete
VKISKNRIKEILSEEIVIFIKENKSSTKEIKETEDKYASLRTKFPDASEEELGNIYSAMHMKES